MHLPRFVLGFDSQCQNFLFSTPNPNIVATRDKTTVLVPAGARIVYFTQSSFNAVVCCFEFALWVDSQLNTSEMFWIDISSWMIRSRCRWISVYLPWRTAHF